MGQGPVGSTATDRLLSESALFRFVVIPMDLERFYEIVLKFLDDSEEQEAVDDLSSWWNR